jgi:hypothetical protein
MLAFDVRPDPVALPIGLFELVLLAAVALFFTTVLLVGMVLFIKSRKRQRPVNAPSTTQTGGLAPQPNQPNQL